MKRLLYLCLIGQLIANIQLYALELYEKLGGVKTNYTFTSVDRKLEIISQFIIKGAERKYEYSTSSINSYEYESYHPWHITN